MSGSDINESTNLKKQEHAWRRTLVKTGTSARKRWLMWQQEARLRSGEFIRRTGAARGVSPLRKRVAEGTRQRRRLFPEPLRDGMAESQPWLYTHSGTRKSRLLWTRSLVDHGSCCAGSANKLPSRPLRPPGCLRQTISLRSIRYSDFGFFLLGVDRFHENLGQAQNSASGSLESKKSPVTIFSMSSGIQTSRE